jgi:CRISPR-associated protein Csm3
MGDIKLFGRLFIKMQIVAKTGLHIGGASGDLEIGGIDNPVIRNPITQEPYIPGSSLKGKIRSQLEKSLGLSQNTGVGQVTIHTCKTREAYLGCDVCQIFGAPGETEAAFPTRLIVRDIAMTEKSKTQLLNAKTDMIYTELKTEVAIDRVTSAASPRNLERVPAGTVFGPSELVFSVFNREDKALFRRMVEGLQLLEDDYLGGSGSRGSGKILFKAITLEGRSTENYAQALDLGDYNSVQALLTDFDEINFSGLFEG